MFAATAASAESPRRVNSSTVNFTTPVVSHLPLLAKVLEMNSWIMTAITATVRDRTRRTGLNSSTTQF